jgi:hypothetical protein
MRRPVTGQQNCTWVAILGFRSLEDIVAFIDPRTLGPSLAVLLILAAVVALCVSIYEFSDPDHRAPIIEAQSMRRLAALSSAITLVIFALIYSGAFKSNLLAALKNFGVSAATYTTVSGVLTDFDEFATHVANTVNVFSKHVGYRPQPSPWPGILLAAAYTVRFSIYRFHTKKENARAALTGSVYWSHLTAYVMAMMFLIVIVGWSAWLVVPISLVALAALIVSLQLLIEDLGEVMAVGIQSAWARLVDGARWVAYGATEFANLMQEAVKHANAAYLARIRTPLRRRTEGLKKANSDRRLAAEERLAEQEARLGKASTTTSRAQKTGRPSARRVSEDSSLVDGAAPMELTGAPGIEDVAAQPAHVGDDRWGEE